MSCRSRGGSRNGKQTGEQTEDSDQLKQEAEAAAKRSTAFETRSRYSQRDRRTNADPCVDPTLLSNAEKAMLVDALKGKHRLNHLLKALELPRSSYYYRADRAKPSQISIMRPAHELSNCSIPSTLAGGYCRIHALGKEGTVVSEKVVRQLMTASGLQVVGKKKRRYTSYAGEITPAPENIIQRGLSYDHPTRSG